MSTDITIHEQPNKLILDVPTFKCDTSLGKHIPEPFSQASFFKLVVGPPGSGKTSLILGALSSKGPNRVYNKVFHDVYLVQPKSSQASIKKSVFKNHPVEKVYDDLNSEVLDELLELIKDNSEDGHYSLIFIDDFASALKDPDIQRTFTHIVNNRRHLFCSIICVCQSYISVPLPVRKTVSDLILFRSANKKDYISVFSELIHLPKDVADQIVQFVFRKPHDFMYIRVASNEIYRNFNKLHIEYD